MTQQGQNLGPQKSLKHVPPSRPNLLIKSPNLQTQILNKQNSKRSNKILRHTITLHSVFHNIQLHHFFSHKMLMTYFLHRTKSFVRNTTGPKFCTLYFVHVKDTRQWMSLDSVG